ncbi:hypothetical protein AJ80_04110 [Polytolypa hystricis UAMH7299]|uniref:Beta-xylanase n=1 Tax=Polytolypa hystricis (strain UAMH7299) TaxID=1447883 RepID=A0A2B7YDA0_POLH7|nr:hypothetical protein AJ80_04110 [Polytolypa hystricis UAMH7299]
MVQLLSTLVTALAAATAVSATPTFGHGKWGKKGLHTEAVKAGLKYFGTAADNVNLHDEVYVDKLLDRVDFGMITPTNTQKWETVEPQEGVFNFTEGDRLINMALRNGQKTRCHALVWHSQLAPWVEEKEWTNKTLIAAMVNHVTKVAKHFKGRCYAWDVLNEALEEDGTYRKTVFLDVIGPAYIPIAFKAAQKADPFAKLYYNDYNLESVSPKSKAAIEIIKLIRAHGGRIDGMGMQGHLILGQRPSFEEQKAVIKSYTDAGVESAYTELDIRMDMPATKKKLQDQSVAYYDSVRACVESKRCVGVTIWDWTDKYSWIPGWFEGEGAGLPWDEDFKKKPAYDGILKALTKKKSWKWW